MSYTNAVFYVDMESGSDTARTALTTVTVANPSGTITRCTKTAHGLMTGAVVDLTLFSAWLNAAWKITVVDADNFDLDGAVWQATAVANGTVTPRGGSSKADAWLTLSSGATAARTAAGDTIRVKASPDPTLVGNATWTQYSKTVTLAGAVTATICDCETAWTGSANVTQTADTAQFKENTKSAKSVIAAGFTTGKVAYFATGTLDLSGYQQVSFWILNTVAITTGMLELRLCSDTTGDTAVNTVAIPAIPSTSNWVPVTVDLATNLGSAIASVSLYANTDPGSNTINLDNILACKAVSSADSLTLTSLIGKVWNLSWAASTAHAANTIRRPTQPNRNGYCYKVTAGGGGNSGVSEPTWPVELGATVTDGALTWTCFDLEDTWYPIQSISGATVKLDNGVNTAGNAGRGYSGATETVATYKREPIPMPMVLSGAINTLQKAGATGSPITYSGGWSRSDMSVQTGETWMSAQNGLGTLFGGGRANITFINLSGVRAQFGADDTFGDDSLISLCHWIGSSHSGLRIYISAPRRLTLNAVCLSMATLYGLPLGNPCDASIRLGRIEGNLSDGVNVSDYWAGLNIAGPLVRNNGAYAVALGGPAPVSLTGVVTGNNANGAISLGVKSTVSCYNCLFPEATEFNLPANREVYIPSLRHDQTADNHLITADGGTIVSATDQRHTASGIAWKFRPTSTNRHASYPLRLSVAKIACNANAQVTLSIWTRRDSTDIKGQLCVRGGQIAGVPSDVTVACEPSVNTWMQAGNLTFTPTAAGVVEVLFLVWDGVGTTNNYWIDDFASAQA